MGRNDLMEWSARAVFAVVGVVHLLPVGGVLGRAVIERAYGVHLGGDDDLTVLMQHRALMFAILAMACAGAVCWPQWRWPIALAMLLSTWGFVAIAALHAPGAAVLRVMWVDVVVGGLLLAWVALAVWGDLP
jgi:hypothetical protein